MAELLPTQDALLRTENKPEAVAFLAKFAEYPPRLQEIGLAFLRGIQYAQRTQPNA